MATYTSGEVTLRTSADKAFDRFSNLEGLASLLKGVDSAAIPADKREMFDNIKITSDTITIPGGPTGPITLRKTREERPVLISMEGEGTPVPLNLSLHIAPRDEQSCVAWVEFELSIPAMLKPMISGPMQKMTEQFSQVLGAIPFND